MERPAGTALDSGSQIVTVLLYTAVSSLRQSMICIETHLYLFRIRLALLKQSDRSLPCSADAANR